MPGRPADLGPEATVVASMRQLSSEVAGDAVILNRETGAYYGLDAVGARVWALVASPVTVAELRDRLVAEFEVEPKRCEADVLVLLGDLVGAGLVEVVAGSPSPPPAEGEDGHGEA